MRTLLALLIALPLVAQQAATRDKTDQEAQPQRPRDRLGAREARPPQPAEAAAESPRSIHRTDSPAASISATAGTDVRGNFGVPQRRQPGRRARLTAGTSASWIRRSASFDRIDTQGLGWGGDPWTTARVDARKMGVYDLTFDYRNIAYFNDLPSYADPLAPGRLQRCSHSIRIAAR